MRKSIVESLLVCTLLIALGLVGYRITRVALSLKEAEHAQTTAGANNGSMILEGEHGIDVNGNVVFPMPPPQETQALIFMLRGDSIHSDALFWRQVSDAIPKQEGVRLVGYCDGLSCANAVRHSPHEFPYLVLEYGEVVGTQAVVNSDTLGEALLRNERWLVPKKILWRAEGKTPLAIIEEMRKL